MTFQKTTRLLAAISHAYAAEHGVTDALITEGRRMRADALTDPAYLPSVAARAWRWGPEMLDAADALQAEGLPADLAAAAAAVFHRWDEDKDDYDTPIEDVLHRLKATRSG